MSRYMSDFIARLELSHCPDTIMVCTAWATTFTRNGRSTTIHRSVSRCLRHFACDVVHQCIPLGYAEPGLGLTDAVHRFALPRDKLVLLYGLLADRDKVRMIKLQGDSTDGRYAKLCYICNRRRWSPRLQMIYGDKP